MKNLLPLLLLFFLFLHCKYEEIGPLYADFSVPANLQAQLSVQFEDRSVGAVSWSWDFGNGQSFSGKTPPGQLYSQEGFYTVSLTVRNQKGATDTKSLAIVVGKPPVIAEFTAPAFAAVNQPVTFTNNSLNATAYLWTFGLNQTSADVNPIWFFSTTGTHDVTLTASNDKGSHSVTKSIEICSTPVAAFTTSSPVYSVGNNVSFTNNSVSAASTTTYLWDFGDGTSSSETSPNKVYQNAGTFTVSLTVTNPCGVNTTTKTIVIIRMQFITSGTFQMGCNSTSGCISAALPVHDVTLDAFFISESEITNDIWQRVMGSTPSSNAGCAQCPVETVSWYHAIVFCNRLSELLGLTPCYYSNPALSLVFGKSGSTWTSPLPNSGSVYWATAAPGYRLPTEAQWERACRGGSASNIYSGSNTLGNVGYYSSNSGGSTKPVKGKDYNLYGVYDMSGNVWEWCYDRYAAYDPDPQFNPTGPATGLNRVVRGGAWGSVAQNCRVDYRLSALPDVALNTYGFRVAR